MQPVDYSIGLLPWVFLGVGLLIGIVAVWKLRSKHRPPSEQGDIELRRADLESQRDELLGRLADESESLDQDDRDQLELRAARTLRELDSLPASPSSPKSSSAGTHKGTPNVKAKRGFWASHPALGGALLGGGLVALVGVLIAVAMQDATPDPEQPTATAPQASNQPGSASQPPLPPFVASEVQRMRTVLEANPEDVSTRRELALMLLSADRPFDAFQEANAVLAQAPDDAEALYITGFVRYLMGQPNEAIAQFDRAIESTPSYSQAWLVKGLILLQVGQREQAIATWEGGLAANGAESRLQHLIDQARSDKSVEEILANPPR